MHRANVTVSQHCLSKTVPESKLARDMAALIEIAEREPDTLSSPLGEGDSGDTPREELTEAAGRLESEGCAPNVGSAAREALEGLPPAP
ncbi:MAG: hypothetical protein H0U14_09215 [Thermoleophilaceae bacterium]|nr:hypothetical protein [Thermoleophilaceae bacterium]